MEVKSETVFDDGTIECKRDCVNAKNEMVFKKGTLYKTKSSGKMLMVYDEMGCMRNLIFNGKPSDIMKNYFD